MNEPTMDPEVWIVERRTREGVVVYKSNDGTTWEIVGTCTACGECEVGISEEEALRRKLVWQGEVGTPFACIEADWTLDRLDSPVTPDIVKGHPHCTLRGRWL